MDYYPSNSPNPQPHPHPHPHPPFLPIPITRSNTTQGQGRRCFPPPGVFPHPSLKYTINFSIVKN